MPLTVEEVRAKLSSKFVLGNQGDRLAEFVTELANTNAAPVALAAVEAGPVDSDGNPVGMGSKEEQEAFAKGYESGASDVVSLLNGEPTTIELPEALAQEVVKLRDRDAIPVNEVAENCNAAREAVKTQAADLVDALAADTNGPAVKGALKRAAEAIRDWELIQSAVEEESIS